MTKLMMPRKRYFAFLSFINVVITEMERYNQVLDTWTHAREAITGKMMEAMEHDYREDTRDGYVNPVFLMAHPVLVVIEQIRNSLVCVV